MSDGGMPVSDLLGARRVTEARPAFWSDLEARLVAEPAPYGSDRTNLAQVEAAVPPPDAWGRFVESVASPQTPPFEAEPDEWVPREGPGDDLTIEYLVPRDKTKPPSERKRWRGVLGAVAAAILVVVGAVVVADGNSGVVVTDSVFSPNVTDPPVSSPTVGPASVEQSMDWAWDPGMGGDRWEPSDVLQRSSWSAAPGCYGLQDPPTTRYIERDFEGGHLTITSGFREPTDIVITDPGGLNTHVGNPFGTDAWVCTVAINGSTALAVGSGVWWSDDGVEWTTVAAFDKLGGSNLDGSNLIWSYAGPLGYVVLGRESSASRLGWYSSDLTSWHEIPLGEGPSFLSWGWIGPKLVAVFDEQIVISMDDGGWVGTPHLAEQADAGS